jgi:hypothetical protein
MIWGGGDRESQEMRGRLGPGTGQIKILRFCIRDSKDMAETAKPREDNQITRLVPLVPRE